MAFGSLFNGPQDRIVLLCLLQSIAFGYGWWNERTRKRDSAFQKRIAYGILIFGLSGSLGTTLWASVDAAHDVQQRSAVLQRTQNLALTAAEHGHVATLTVDQQQRITTLLRPFAPVKTDVTCMPGASDLCDPLVAALRAADFTVDYSPNYVNQGMYLDVGPISIPHRIMVTTLHSAAGASDALVAELKQQRFDVGVPDPKQWTQAAQDAYATKSLNPYPLQIFVTP